MDSPALRALPPKNSPARGRSWIPFHVVHLAGDALDECCKPTGQELRHRRGRATDPLYKARRILHTRSCLLTPRQQHQLADLFASDCHVALEVTWSVYQNIIDAYRAPDTRVGKALMQAEIDRLSDTGVPRSLTELTTLGRTLKRRAGDILTYFDHPHTSNGPTETINGRLEHLHGSALGLAKPHQLHHPSTPRNRRIQTPTTPPIMKSYTPNYEEPVIEVDPRHRCPPDRAPGLTLDASAGLTARSHDPHPLEKTHPADSDSGEHLVDRPRRREE